MPLHPSVMHRLFLALLLCVGLWAPTAFADDGGGDSLPSIFDWFEQKGISGTASTKVQITFGRNKNQTHHAFRHMDEAGIRRDAVRNAIKPDAIKSSGEIKSGQFNGTVNIDGKRIDYSAFKFQDGSA